MGGWDQLRSRLVGDGERPMIYFTSNCRDSIRTLPALQQQLITRSQRRHHERYHCGWTFARVPQIRVTGSIQIVLCRAQFDKFQLVLFDESTEKAVGAHGHLVATRPHRNRKPDNGVHITMTAHRHEYI